jgi:hypothetical protein
MTGCGSEALAGFLSGKWRNPAKCEGLRRAGGLCIFLSLPALGLS